MRKRIKFEDQWYKPVPWIKEGDCTGCAMQSKTQMCLNDMDPAEPCSEGEFRDKVFIRCGSKEGLAEYIAKKLSN